jgi:uncharacterized membrane protein YjdF
MLPFALIASLTSAVIIVFSLVARVPGYRLAPLFLIPAVWAIFFLRKKIHLHPFHYALLALAILLHMSGAFGFYQKSPFPVSFDIVVHYYFAIAIAFVLHRGLSRSFPLTRWQLRITVLLFMMGLGALHEIMEYMSYLVGGEERGMLKPRTSYFFDTQRDLTNNFLGTLTALLLLAFAPAQPTSLKDAKPDAVAASSSSTP